MSAPAAITQEPQEVRRTRPVTKPDALRSQQLSAQSAPWRAFVQENGPGWIASWNQATETPEAIYGVGMRLRDRPVQVGEIGVLSWEVLHRYRELLGTGDSTYRVAVDAAVNGVHIFVYDQYYRGLPVIGGRADVRINQRGILAMLGSQTFPIPGTFDTTPAIGAPQARIQAYAALGVRPADLTPPTPARLVIWGDVDARTKSPVHLAWEIAVHEPEQGVAGRAFIDARTAALLRFESDIHHVSHPAAAARGNRAPLRRTPEAPAPSLGPGTISGTVMAWVNTGLSPNDPPQNVPLANLSVTIPGVGTAFTDASGTFSIAASDPDPVEVTVGLTGQYIGDVIPVQGSRVQQTLQVTPGIPAQFQLLDPAASEFDLAQTTTYWHTGDVHEYVLGVLPPAQAGAMVGLQSIVANVNVNQSCNAFYLNNTLSFFASDVSCNNTAYSTIITHEWGHGLDFQYGGISQIGGLSEGWSDIVAMYHSGQPIVGEDFQSNGANLRTGLNLRQYPADECGGMEHCQGETWMGFGWKVREHLRGRLGDAAGIAHAEQIVLGSIVANATTQPDAVREVFLLDDDDGNFLNGTPNFVSLLHGATQHGLPYPERDVVEFDHTALGDTEAGYVPRVVTLTATPLFGSLNEVRVIVTADSVGGVPMSRTMVPTGNPDEYVALLPGYDSPDVVSYFIESRHEDGDITRLPGAGNFVYQVGVGETFLFDDFESGAAGWTHGMAAVQDDWQLGTPGGAFGSDDGVDWFDPAAASSGLNAWGNDLGPIGFNGAYSSNVENWLRAPSINTLGKFGVTLSFARWLTVEEHQYDQATIVVNGQEVWANPDGFHLLDTGWTTQTLPIPMADDQPAVDIDWRLDTDATVEFGGWNIDDVHISTLGAAPVPDILYRIQPEQTPIGGPMALTAFGTPNIPAAILFSPSPGPTSIPGLPTLSVGADATVIPVPFNSLGIIFASLNAPDRPALIGRIVYSQVIALENGTDIVVSNPSVILFAQ